MADEKMVTEAEAVKRERAACEAGAFMMLARLRANCGSELTGFVESEAKRRYPLAVTRARVVTDSNGTKWRVVNDVPEWMDATYGHTWQDGSGKMWITTERVRILASLLASPLETVDADSQSDGEESIRSVPGQEADR